jgi:hypothetical protein
MGYYTKYTGGINIIPSIMVSELGEDTAKYLPTNGNKLYLDVLFGVEMSRSTACDMCGRFDESDFIVSIEPRAEVEYKGYEMESTLRLLCMSLVAKHHVRFDGSIGCQGEDGRVWKFVYKDGDIKRVNAKLVFEDE